MIYKQRLLQLAQARPTMPAFTSIAVQITSIGFLVTVTLIVNVVVSITVKTIILTKSKITAAFARANREESSTHAESA